MRAITGFTVLSVMLVLAAGCNRAGPADPSPALAPAPDADAATIRAATAHWIDAYNAGEVDDIVALYTEDAVLMPGNAPMLVGRVAIRDYLVKDTAAAKAAGLTNKDGVGDVGVSGDLAWHAGTSSVVDASGKTVETGKYIEVWRRTNGQWLMVRDIWNDDAPPAPAK
jgi:ketosteroid isomerase-like protein